jgi:hypothetical protein
MRLESYSSALLGDARSQPHPFSGLELLGGFQLYNTPAHKKGSFLNQQKAAALHSLVYETLNQR